MRIKAATVLLVGAALAVTTTACGSGSASPRVASAKGATGHPSASPTSTLSLQESQVKFAECMRAHGVNMPDPQVNDNGGVSIMIPKGTPKEKVDAAQEACKEYLPNGGEPPKLSAEQLAQQRKFAQCMRDHGISDFPDPDPDGAIKIEATPGSDMGPDSPAFQSAQSECAKYQPDGGKNGPGMSTQKGDDGGDSGGLTTQGGTTGGSGS